MGLHFDHVFAGIGMRPVVGQIDDLIQRFTTGRAQDASSAHGALRFRIERHQCLSGHLVGVLTRQSNESKRRATDRGCDRSNDVRKH